MWVMEFGNATLELYRYLMTTQAAFQDRLCAGLFLREIETDFRKRVGAIALFPLVCFLVSQPFWWRSADYYRKLASTA